MITALLLGAVAATPAQERAVELQFEAIWAAIDAHAEHRGSLPNSLSDLTGDAPSATLERTPLDPWDKPFVWLRPIGATGRGCLLSGGPDRRPGTLDDLRSECEPSELNPFLLAEAGRRPYPVLDAFGRKIRVIRRRRTTMVWSFGPDGQPDTPDDLVARVRPASGHGS